MTTTVHPQVQTADATVAQARRARWQRWRRDNGAPLLMALPAILLLFIFAYLPMFGLSWPSKNTALTRAFWAANGSG